MGNFVGLTWSQAQQRFVGNNCLFLAYVNCELQPSICKQEGPTFECGLVYLIENVELQQRATPAPTPPPTPKPSGSKK